MKASIDISLYPLNREGLPAIDALIAGMSQYPNIALVKNDLSTQIFGDFDVLMNRVQTEIKERFAHFEQIALTLKNSKDDLRQPAHG